MKKEERYEIIFIPDEGRAIKDNYTKKIYSSEFRIIEELQQENKKLLEVYNRMYNINCKAREYIEKRKVNIKGDNIYCFDDDLLKILKGIDNEKDKETS